MGYEYGIPLMMGLMRGIGGYLSGGGGKDDPITGMPLGGTDEAIPLSYRRYMGDLGTVGAVAAQRAARDISAPGAFVQPPFGGTWIENTVLPIGFTGRDPALARPELLRRAGIDWGTNPPFGGQVSGAEVFRSAEQVSPPQPRLGGGLQEVENALGLMGVKRNASGMLTFAANQFGPTSGQQNIRRLRRRDAPPDDYSPFLRQPRTEIAGEPNGGNGRSGNGA